MLWAQFTRCAVLALLLGLAAQDVLVGQTSNPGESGQATQDPLRQDAPSFLVRADVNHTSRLYREGQELQVRVVSEEDAYLYVWYKQADGSVYQIFPNSAQSDNHVRAGQTVQIPDHDDSFTWMIAAPFGREVIKVFAAKKPLPPLENVALDNKRFNPVSKEQIKALEVVLRVDDPLLWAEDYVVINTYPRSHQAESTGERRWGVFFGVSNYKYNAEHERATGGRGKWNLPGCQRDARKLATVLSEVGQLTGAKVYTNQQATRANLQYAVTGWLAEKSHPGDTVMIYFSGHGGQVSDDHSDEQDGRDEFLVPYDFFSLGELAVIDKEAARKLIQREGSVEKADQWLVRDRGVTDDQFGHWLQRLAGRRVIVILDICHAGGFATVEKELFSTAKATPFGFLDGELARLKDIGQPGSSLLAACGAQQNASVRVQKDLSVMTYYLIRALIDTSGSLTLEQGKELCGVGMASYFERLNQALQAAGKETVSGHQPYVIDNCTPPALLKP